MIKNKFTLMLFCTVATIFTGCSTNNSTHEIPIKGDFIEATDYSDKNNWMAQPDNPEMAVDVFCLYPTSWYRENKNDSPISTIDSKQMRENADVFLKSRFSLFDGVGNIYAPYYRQLDAIFLLKQPPSEQGQYLKGVPKTDVIAAFDYYVNNLNTDRPFILAGHSQGSMLTKELLFDYLKMHPDVAKRMVAAYVIGFSVTQKDMANNPHLKFAEGPDDTGVIISYNTESPDMVGKNSVWLPDSIAINPISWTRTNKTAPATDNLGSYIQIDNTWTKVDMLADATVDTKRGVILCSSVDIDTYSISNPNLFDKGVYHTYDIGFYYYNLRQNAENRISKYLESHPQNK